MFAKLNRGSLNLLLAVCILFAALLPAGLLAACNAPVSGAAVAPIQVAAAGLQESPYPTLILAGPDATATPTPFQPLPPTPYSGLVYVPASAGQPVQPLQPLDATSIAAATAEAPTPLPTLVPTAAPTATPTPLPAELAQIPNQINVLLLGADRRPWDRQFRTDTIMLVTINSQENSVNILSFPRDLYVTIPGYGMGRINTAWTFGGYPLLRQTFRQNFGIQVDYYALIEFSTFKKVIDNFGGLEVEVGETVSDYRAGYWITVPAGKQQMDADDVLWYVRTRKTTNDIARNRRQQEVLMAIFNKLVSLDGLSRAPQYFEAYRQVVQTDVVLVDVLRWLPVAIKVTESGNFHHYFISYNHVYDWITPEGAMVLVPQQAALMGMIRKSQNLP